MQNILMKGSSQVKFPTICRDESKEEKTRREKETESKEKNRRKKIHVRVVIVFSESFVGREGRKVGSPKRRSGMGGGVGQHDG